MINVDLLYAGAQGLVILLIVGLLIYSTLKNLLGG